MSALASLASELSRKVVLGELEEHIKEFLELASAEEHRLLDATLARAAQIRDGGAERSGPVPLAEAFADSLFGRYTDERERLTR